MSDKKPQDATREAVELDEAQLDQATGGTFSVSEPPDPGRAVSGEPPDPVRVISTRTY